MLGFVGPFPSLSLSTLVSGGYNSLSIFRANFSCSLIGVQESKIQYSTKISYWTKLNQRLLYNTFSAQYWVSHVKIVRYCYLLPVVHPVLAKNLFRVAVSDFRLLSKVEPRIRPQCFALTTETSCGIDSA